MPLSKKRVDRVPTYDPMEENKKLRHPSKQQVNWNEKYKELVGYKEEHGDYNVPRHYSKNNLKLGTWVKSQRELFRKGAYSEERYQERFHLLEEIGFSWDFLLDKWEVRFTELLNFGFGIQPTSNNIVYSHILHISSLGDDDQLPQEESVIDYPDVHSFYFFTMNTFVNNTISVTFVLYNYTDKKVMYADTHILNFG